ncbi:MAG: hypothetical protein O2894_05010 [Planctomycetota bacterium]|nr:hypothetical protein [Planctomycetota bacterium]
MVVGLDDPDALPRLPLPAFICVVALLIVAWVLLRVHVLRRELAREREPTTKLPFLHAIAANPKLRNGLLVLAAALAGAAYLLA